MEVCHPVGLDVGPGDMTASAGPRAAEAQAQDLRQVDHSANVFF